MFSRSAYLVILTEFLKVFHSGLRLSITWVLPWLVEQMVSDFRSEATTSWTPRSLLLGRRFTTVWTFYVTVLHRSPLDSQLRDSHNKPPLALLSSGPFHVSLVGLVSSYSSPIHLLAVGKYYLFRDSFDTFLTVTSPCGAATSLNIKSELRVSNAANPGGSGFILADDVGSIHSICMSLLNLSFSRRLMAHSSRFVIWFF